MSDSVRLIQPQHTVVALTHSRMAFNWPTFGARGWALLLLINMVLTVLVWEKGKLSDVQQQSSSLGQRTAERSFVQTRRLGAGASDSAESHPSFEDIWESLAATVPSAPVDFMKSRLLDESAEGCVRVPRPAELSIANDHWQLLRLDFEVHLFSAHFDGRSTRKFVRLVTMIDR